MAHNEDDTNDSTSSNSAPDLQILGDQITLQPSGYVEPSKIVEEGKEEALMDKFASFRSEPLQYDAHAVPSNDPGLPTNRSASGSSAKFLSTSRGKVGAPMTVSLGSPSSTRASPRI